jgi:hypothetical protein
MAAVAPGAMPSERRLRLLRALGAHSGAKGPGAAAVVVGCRFTSVSLTSGLSSYARLIGGATLYTHPIFPIREQELYDLPLA